MLKSVLLILSGNAAASLLLLIRNLLVARMIPVADYGIAATFAIAMAVVEMMSNLGLQQQIIQAKNGENPKFQAALQGFQVLRGILAGILLFLIAKPLANFLNVPDLAWAYQVLALIPVLNAFTHFDIHRLNRSMVFGPLIVTSVLPALLSVLAVWPLAVFFGDYKVMLIAIFVQTIMTVATSHLMAKRPYQLALDAKEMARSFQFGWPLLANGLLLFAVFQGDKLIVGRLLGMETLAIFAMGFTLTLTPTLVMARSLQNFFLPQLSSLDHHQEADQPRFQHLSMTAMQGSLLGGSLLVAGVALIGPLLVETVLGDKYLSLIPLLLPMAVMQAVRVAKTGASVVALATGHTTNPMLANLVRIATLPLAWIVLLQGADLYTVILIATAGEALGYLLSLWLIARRPGVLLRPLLGSVLITTALLIFASWPAVSGSTPTWLHAGILLAVAFTTILPMTDLRRFASTKGVAT